MLLASAVLLARGPGAQFIGKSTGRGAVCRFGASLGLVSEGQSSCVASAKYRGAMSARWCWSASPFRTPSGGAWPGGRLQTFPPDAVAADEPPRGVVSEVLLANAMRRNRSRMIG